MKTAKINRRDLLPGQKNNAAQRILLQLLNKPVKTQQLSPEPIQSGIYIGTLKKITYEGQVLVEISDIRPGVEFIARATCSVDKNDIGKKVALSFPVNNDRNPLILGVIRNENQKTGGDLYIHGQVQNATGRSGKLILDAENEITLQCGKSSITLTAEGKIIIKGEYISSRATGVHRIKGGAVQIN